MTGVSALSLARRAEINRPSATGARSFSNATALVSLVGLSAQLAEAPAAVGNSVPGFRQTGVRRDPARCLAYDTPLGELLAVYTGAFLYIGASDPAPQGPGTPIAARSRVTTAGFAFFCVVGSGP